MRLRRRTQHLVMRRQSHPHRRRLPTGASNHKNADKPFRKRGRHGPEVGGSRPQPVEVEDNEGQIAAGDPQAPRRAHEGSQADPDHAGSVRPRTGSCVCR